MSEGRIGGRSCDANRHCGGIAASLGAADWLSLAAAPTFAIMALLTGAFGGPPDVLCSAGPYASLLGGMVPMYVLMSAFHAAPWLKLLSRRPFVVDGHTCRTLDFVLSPVEGRAAHSKPCFDKAQHAVGASRPVLSKP